MNAELVDASDPVLLPATEAVRSLYTFQRLVLAQVEPVLLSVLDGLNAIIEAAEQNP